MKVLLSLGGRRVVNTLYGFAHRRSPWLKSVCKQIGQATIGMLARAKEFDVPTDYLPTEARMVLGMLLNTYESATVACLKKIVRPGMTVVDVGAHVGYYSRLCARLVGSSGRVYAFEAHPQTYRILKRNTRKYPHVVPVPMAVLEETKAVTLHESPVGSGSHSLFPHRYRPRRAIDIDGTSLDDFFRDRTANLIKIDVEGAELEVLQGMRNLIRRSKDLMLIIEFFPLGLTLRNVPPAVLLETLEGLGFQLHAIQTDGSATPLAALGNREDLICSIKKYVNLLALRGDVRGSVRL